MAIHKFCSITSIVVFVLSSRTAKTELVAKPRDTEAVIGDSTYFDCASNVNRNEVHWHHYALGAKNHEDVCLYCLGKVHPHYEKRIEVKGNVSTGSFRLRIKSVQQEDAGRYICQDNGGIGESTSAQLVILESIPSCTSNMKPDGVLGPNNCGLELDTLLLSCHVSYHGNIPPVIKWRKSDKEDSANPFSCQNIDNQMTCNLTMTVDLGLNGVSYICETNRSTATQYNCTSDIIRVIYVKPDNAVKKIVQDEQEKFICSVNSSQSCNHTWKWFDGVQEEIVANGSALITHKPGWYQCESECNIRGKQCTVLSKMVLVSEPKSLTRTVMIAVICSVILTVGFVFAGVGFINLRKRIKAMNHCRQHSSTGQEQSFLKDESGRPPDVKER